MNYPYFVYEPTLPVLAPNPYGSIPQFDPCVRLRMSVSIGISWPRSLPLLCWR